MGLWLQILVSGLATGSVYGLLAAGHTIVFRVSGVVHFALGDLVSLGVFTTLFVAVGSGPVTQASAATGRFALALVAGLILTAAISAGSYMAFVQPYVARGSTLGWVAGSVAIAFAIQAILSALFIQPGYVFPDPIPFHEIGNDGIVSVAGATVQVEALFVIVVGLMLAGCVSFVIRATRYGLALRAIAEDTVGARIVGIPVERHVAGAFGLVGALSMLIAVAAAPSAPFSVSTGSVLGLKGLLAALAVSFVEPVRAFAVGVAIGVAESVIASGRIGGHGIGQAWSEVIPIGALLLVVVVRSRRRAGWIE